MWCEPKTSRSPGLASFIESTSWPTLRCWATVRGMVDAEVLHHLLHQARAVQPGRRVGAAPLVGDAEVLLRVGHHVGTGRAGPRRTWSRWSCCRCRERRARCSAGRSGWSRSRCRWSRSGRRRRPGRAWSRGRRSGHPARRRSSAQWPRRSARRRTTRTADRRSARRSGSAARRSGSRRRRCSCVLPGREAERVEWPAEPAAADRSGARPSWIAWPTGRPARAARAPGGPGPGPRAAAPRAARARGPRPGPGPSPRSRPRRRVVAEPHQLGAVAHGDRGGLPGRGDREPAGRVGPVGQVQRRPAPRSAARRSSSAARLLSLAPASVTFAASCWSWRSRSSRDRVRPFIGPPPWR